MVLCVECIHPEICDIACAHALMQIVMQESSYESNINLNYHK
jgi:hypothetical protein